MSLFESERAWPRRCFDGDVVFDRTRPVCPAEIFDDLVALGGLPGGSRVVEIGGGTRQATQPLAEGGLVVTAVELAAPLADVARAKLARFASVEVITASVEEWEPGGPCFDAVAAFNSLHWVDPELCYAKPVPPASPAQNTPPCRSGTHRAGRWCLQPPYRTPTSREFAA